MADSSWMRTAFQPPSCFADVVQEIRAENVAWPVEAPFQWTPTSRPFSFLVWFWNGLSRITAWAAGSFMFCEASAFREAGGFNQALYAGEEIDLFPAPEAFGSCQGPNHRRAAYASVTDERPESPTLLVS